MKNHSRLAYVDIAKGVAMLLVIIGHCSYSEKILVGWLYSFHMPLFFALSGFTFRPEKYKSLVVRVAGYSALFTTLSKSLQEDIINRTEQQGF
jgi:fucose 4-O-acetylase-like acetyltransferase